MRSALYLLLGGLATHSLAPGQASLPHSPRLGESHLDLFGTCVVAVGDLNGDMISDLAVGAPQADSGAFSSNGAVFFYSGADLSVSLGVYRGTANGENAGASLAALGDVDGDGIADVAVGAPRYNGAGGNRQGRVVVVSGASRCEIVAFTSNDAGAELGRSLAPAGDRDGDGIVDLLAGAPRASAIVSEGGAAFLLRVTASVITPLARKDGSQIFEHMGTSVCAINDQTGDGRGELVIASPDHDGSFLNDGRVQVYSGDPTQVYPLIMTLSGGEIHEQFGWRVAPIQDPVAPPVQRLLISFPGRTNNGINDGGGAGIYAVPSGTLLRSYQGDVSGSKLGFSLSPLPDQDGDGVEDFLIGSPFSAPFGQFLSGQVDLVSVFGNGVIGGALSRLHRAAGASGDRLGDALASVGDLDGDGCADYAAGATGYYDAVLQEETGALVVLRSNRPTLETDTTQYFDFSPIVITIHGFAARRPFLIAGTALSGLDTWMISFGSPWVLATLPLTDADGRSILNAAIGNLNGQPLTTFLQSVSTNAGGKNSNFLFSTLATIQIN